MGVRRIDRIVNVMASPHGPIVEPDVVTTMPDLHLGLDTDEQFAAATRAGRNLVHAVQSVVLGDGRAVRLAVAAFLAGGHVLVEDSPGVGKTLLARAVAAGIGGRFARIQGTADLLPTEITGVEVFEPASQSWSFREGPIFAHVVIIDELNRATPRAQSALLEAMAERQVSADGVSRALPTPFFVVATQNPVGDVGTYPLVSGQRDRFMVSLRLGIPSPDVERAMLLGDGGPDKLAALRAVAPIDRWHDACRAAGEVGIAEPIADYVLAVVHQLRAIAGGSPLLSPRAMLAVASVARGWAILEGRSFVLPDDVKAVAPAVLGHRLDAAQSGAGIDGGAAVVQEVLAGVAAPPIA